jgi:hypothetical protein
MSRPTRSLLLVGLVACAIGVGAAIAAALDGGGESASEQVPVSPGGPVSTDNTAGGSDYWTEERMREARPVSPTPPGLNAPEPVAPQAAPDATTPAP